MSATRQRGRSRSSADDWWWVGGWEGDRRRGHGRGRKGRREGGSSKEEGRAHGEERVLGEEEVPRRAARSGWEAVQGHEGEG